MPRPPAPGRGRCRARPGAPGPRIGAVPLRTATLEARATVSPGFFPPRNTTSPRWTRPPPALAPRCRRRCPPCHRPGQFVTKTFTRRHEQPDKGSPGAPVPRSDGAHSEHGRFRPTASPSPRFQARQRPGAGVYAGSLGRLFYLRKVFSRQTQPRPWPWRSSQSPPGQCWGGQTSH